MAMGVELIMASLVNATFGGAVMMDIIVNQKTYIMLAKEVNGKHLKVATYDSPPISSVEIDRSNNSTLSGKGVAFYILDIIREKFNFTYEIVLPRKNFIMGGSDPEDSVIGLVSTGKVDMAAALIPNILEFRKFVTFSIDIDEEAWVMLLKRPAESAVGEGLLAPFTSHVWYLILIAVVTFAPFISILTRIRAKLMLDEEPATPFYTSVWFVYGAFIRQNTRYAPKANSTRVLLASWWLFTMLLSAFYTGNMTAFLTQSEFTLAIEHPVNLYWNNHPWVAAEGSAVQYTVKSPQTEEMFYLNEMVKKKRAQFKSYTNISDYFKLIDKGFVLVRSYHSVVHGMYHDYFKKTKQGVPERERCTYVIATNPFEKNLRGFIYPKNSKLKTLFDKMLGIINQSGVVDVLKTHDLPFSKICPMNLQSKGRKLQNTDLTMTYKITVLGLCLAIAVFIGEIILKKGIHKNKHGKDKKTRLNKNTTEHYFQDSHPPPYQAIFGKASKIKLSKNARKKVVNGTEYLVVDTQEGTRLIPVRTPSAFLYNLEKNTLGNNII